jgi:hypothetical protein
VEALPHTPRSSSVHSAKCWETKLNITEKYLNALTNFDDWLTVSEWAIKVGGLYPDLLEKAEVEAANQVSETTGLREIAARISSAISRGAYAQKIEIDSSEHPRKVRYLSKEQVSQHEKAEIEEDTAPLKRTDIIKAAELTFSTEERYRISEFEAIAKQIKDYFALNFEVDHAAALLNKEKPGAHHPNNLQLLLKAHNGKKSNCNWERFSIEEQCSYIKSSIDLQGHIASRLSIDMAESVVDSLLERLDKVY